MELYESKYTGEEMDACFDKMHDAQVFAGNFTSVSGSLVTVDVGFEPDLVICYNATYNNDAIVSSSNSSAGSGYIPRILTKAFSNSYGSITTNGFKYQNSTNTTIYYIAIKF